MRLSRMWEIQTRIFYLVIYAHELLIDITPRNCFVLSNDLAAVYSSPLRVQLQEVERSCLKHGPAEEEPQRPKVTSRFHIGRYLIVTIYT